MHSTFLANKEKTCIDCHKGIAHQLPYIPPGEAPTDTPGQVVPVPAKERSRLGQRAMRAHPSRSGRGSAIDFPFAKGS
jgi:cytochrome c-type protein NapC